jgi:hypothetical protein
MREVSYVKPLGFSHIDLLRMRIWIEKGKITDMVVQYESFINSSWHIIIRYDCSHGFFHRDVIYPNGRKEKKSFDMSSLEDALEFAENDINSRYEFYKDRYIKKIKK